MSIKNNITSADLRRFTYAVQPNPYQVPVQDSLLFWFDPSYAPYMTLSGSFVTGMYSSSSLGLVASYPAWIAPTQTNYGSKKVIYFQGVSPQFGNIHFMKISGSHGPYTHMTTFIMWNSPTDPTSASAPAPPSYPFQWGYSGGIGYVYGLESGQNAGGSKDKIDVFGGGAKDANFTGSNLSQKDVWHLSTITVSGNISASAFRNNGTQATLYASSSVPISITFGDGQQGFGGSDGGRYTGSIGEIIVYGKVLSLAQIQSVESYLNSKWNIY